YGASRISTLPHYGAEGHASRWFDSGEVSALAIRAATSSAQLVDFNVQTNFLAAGHYSQNVTLDRRGQLRGSGSIAGLQIGGEYGLHDYDRARRNTTDRIALVSAGPSFEHDVYVRGVTLRVRVDTVLTFAGVHSYARDAYERLHGEQGLPSVLKLE